MERNALIGSIIMMATALLIIGAAIPLVKRKIKRNIFYGYRISIYALSDDDIWYAVNEMGGRHIIFLGLGLIVFGLAELVIGYGEVQRIIFSSALIIFVTGTIAYSMWKTIRLAHSMGREKGLKK